jgi:hypothetical protein
MFQYTYLLLLISSIKLYKENLMTINITQHSYLCMWSRCTLNFLDDRTNYKAKDIIEKITNLFCRCIVHMHFFQIDIIIL